MASSAATGYTRAATAQQFTKLGLMPGDLVTAINGTPLDDPARGMEILQSMNSATDVTVTVERNGQTYADQHQQRPGRRGCGRGGGHARGDPGERDAPGRSRSRIQRSDDETASCSIALP